MGKVVLYTIVGFFVLAFIISLVFILSINTIVKSSIEDIGTELTGTAVTVDRVAISPFSGKGRISGFRVANPDDYSRDYALEVDDFSIELNVFSLLTNEVQVRRVVITTPGIYVEQKLPHNNIYTILSNIRSKTAGQTSDVNLIIDYFLMTDGSADLYTEIGGERSARVEVSTIELTNPGRGGEREALENVIREIAEHVAREALRAAAQSGGEQIRNAIQDLFN